METTISTANIIILLIIVALILFFVYINKKRIIGNFNNSNSNYSEFKSDPEALKDSSLDQNGLQKNEFKETGMNPSYWYNYAAAESRSKCFACDAEGNFRHGSNCIDCETKGGRPVDKLLNRVLTR
jgi:hypothetical protein